MTQEATAKHAPAKAAAATLAAAPHLASAAEHPRLLLDAKTRSRLVALAAANDATWKTLKSRCALFLHDDVSSGYYGLQWAEAVASLSLCYHATHKPAYATGAIHYLGGLLDDRDRIGDGKGGDAEIERNSGYPIRARGVFAALGYDWLYHAPGMTAALRAHIGERLAAWIAWYQRAGYLNADPFSNYFWGYMATVSLAGLALSGEDARAGAWLHTARDELFAGLVIPGFRNKLAGGGWAEGWQYGPRVATEAAMVVRAFETATGAHYAGELPWLGQVVAHHLYALHPSYATAYANATHIRRPAIPDPDALRGVLIALDAAAPETAARARFILDDLYSDNARGLPWLAFFTARPKAARIDPRTGAPLSYHAAGPGLSLMRSSWRKDAVWAAFQAGPRVSVDHQHNDQGHFELWRGGDALLIDGGDDTGVATINHNSILIDDGGQILSYTPNQGVWGYDVSTTRYAADGRAVVAVGDLTSAYDPGCVRSGCTERAVKKVVRTVVYVRPGALVVRDRIVLADPSFGATWIAHGLAPFAIADGWFSVTRQKSRAWGRILLPRGEKPLMRKEPTTTEDYIYLRDSPYTDMWRVDVASPRGRPEREFLVWMVATASDADRPRVMRVMGEGIDGGVGDLGDGRLGAVLFAASPAGGRIDLPAGLGPMVVVGLDPGARYRAHKSMTAGKCQLDIARAATGTATASSGGAVIFASGCR